MEKLSSASDGQMAFEFQRIDKNDLLRGREALTALLQRERVDAVSSTGGHIAIAVDGGLRIVGFDTLPDESWQIGEDKSKEIVRCATGEQQLLSVQRVLYVQISEDKVVSLLWNTRLHDELELVVITQAGGISVHAWDKANVAWKLMSTNKLPLIDEEGFVIRATFGLDGNLYWLEGRIQMQQSSDNDSDDSDNDSDSSSSSGGGWEGFGVVGKYCIVSVCCCALNGDGKGSPIKRSVSVEELFDLTEILSSAPKRTFEGKKALCRNLVLPPKTSATLIPASHQGIWGLFSTEDANRANIARLTYLHAEMPECDDLWELFPNEYGSNRSDVSPRDSKDSDGDSSCDPCRWMVDAGVARTHVGHRGEMVVLHEDGTLLRYATEPRSSTPLEIHVSDLGPDLGKRAVDMFDMKNLVGVVTRDGSIVFLDSSTGSAIQEVKLPQRKDADRAFSARYVQSERMQWRAVDSKTAPWLREGTRQGLWSHESADTAMLWLVGVGLWSVEGGMLERTRSDTHAAAASRQLDAPEPEPEEEPESELVVALDTDEDMHLIQLLRSASEKGNLDRLWVLCDEVLARLQEPALLLAMLPPSQREGYAKARKQQVLGLSVREQGIGLLPHSDQAPEHERSARSGSATGATGEDDEVCRVADGLVRGAWATARLIHAKPDSMLRAFCRRTGTVLEHGPVVQVDAQRFVAFARMHGCVHGGAIDCSECGNQRDIDVVCPERARKSVTDASPSTLSIISRLLYERSPQHLLPFVYGIIAHLSKDCTKEQLPAVRRRVCESACALLPCISDQGIKHWGQMADTRGAVRLRAVCTMLQEQGKALQGVKMLVEAGLWDDVTDTVRKLRGSYAAEDIVSVTLQVWF